jgi:hypothetical protein
MNNYSKRFGFLDIKTEGAPTDPRDYTWECDLDECPKCRIKFEKALMRYYDYQRRRRPTRMAH